MKRSKHFALSITLGVSLLLMGCDKKDSLYYGDGSSQSADSITENISNEASKNVEDIEPAPSDITPQKISELHKELVTQINTVKNAGYKNLHITEDCVVKIHDADTLYDLTLTKPKIDFAEYYDRFDKTFNGEFGEIYTEEEKEKLYHAMTSATDSYTYGTDTQLLANRIDKIISGEEELVELYVETDKAYLAMFAFSNGIYGMNHDGTVKRANADRTKVFLSFGTDYFDVVKNYLDVDSEDRYEILDAELSVKEAAETAKNLIVENEYSYGGSIDPEIYQVKVLDIGGGKYGFSFTITAAYKGVKFEADELQKDSIIHTYGENEPDHNYKSFAPNAFMMEHGKLDSFTRGVSDYSAAETAAHDSVISFEDAARILSEKFGTGMNLSVSRAELMHSPMYRLNDDDNTEMAAFPIWKFRCHNSIDDFKFVVYVNAINGDVEYYITDWWEV